MMRKIVSVVFMVLLAGCSPALWGASAVAAADCAAPVLGALPSAPSPAGLLGAAACFLGRVGSDLEPAPELGALVGEAGEAVQAAEARPLDARARSRARQAVAACDAAAGVR